MANANNPMKPAPNLPPGAMGSRPPEPKILRIGVIQAGKIIEERLIRRRESVTIGASPRNTLVVPASTLPRSFTLFEMTAGQYSLRFNDAMDGRVSVENQVLSLAQVRESGKARAAKDLYSLALNEGSRGKVLLGEITLLFQFVTPPPVQPRPQLPPSVRGGIFFSMDWVLLSSFCSIALVGLIFIVYLKFGVSIPLKLEPDVIPDRFADFVPEVKQPTALDLSKLAKTGEQKVEKVEKAAGSAGGGKRHGPARKAAPCDKACQEAKAEARRARLAAAVSKMGVLKILGTKGSGAGTASNLISGGDPNTDADKAFAGVGGLTVAGAGGKGGGLRGKGGGGDGKAVGIGDLGGRVGGPGSVGTGNMLGERVPKAIVNRAAPDIDGTMNGNEVAETIRRGMAAVKTCYQRALKRAPNLAGKITVRMSVNTMGKVTAVTIEDNSMGDQQVAECIKSYAMRWRFPPPEGGTAEVSVPFNFRASQ